MEAWAVEPAELARVLGTDPRRGLTAREAARRLAVHGPNQIRPAPPVPLWRRLLAQFRDPLVYLLLVAVLVSAGAWVAGGATGWPVDAIVIGLIVLGNAVIGLVQEARAESAVAALRRMSAATATVVRDGRPRRVPAAELVPGDLLEVAEGDAVAADARLVSATALQVSEASLTGESEPVRKRPATLAGPVPLADRVNMVHSGTGVTQGSGRALVTATGMATQMGQIAGMLEETEEEPTPLQREIVRVGRALGIAVLVIAAVVIGTLLLTRGARDAQDTVTILLLGVALAVAAVPEGLPAILSLVLAIGVRRMAYHRAIVRKLSSVETLGSASVICSDKTGTLTKNEMTIGRVVTASGEVRVTGEGYRPVGRFEHGGAPLAAGPVREEVSWVIAGGSLANNAVLEQDDHGRWAVHGDPTEAAFLVARHKLPVTGHPPVPGLPSTAGDPASTGPAVPRLTRIGEVPFTSERKRMTTLQLDPDRGGRILVTTKGAPDVLLDRCTRVQVGAHTAPLDEPLRARLRADVDRLSRAAYRTLGVAYRYLDATGTAPADPSVERDLIYAGTVGMIDPPRPEVPAAVREAQRAGVRIIMITGDHPLTAARIAADLGIAEPGRPAVTGAQLAATDPGDLVELVRRSSVFARVEPRHKLAIVDALQAGGGIVAMTGDGVNDAPALKSADIGIAMGITGTEVTKEAAKMVLADDNFATIVQAVRQGRQIFDNIRKFLRYLLSSNMGEVLTVFFGVVLAGAIGLTGDGLVLPLLATQILWINLLTDSGPALAMGVDPEVDDVMARPPRRLAERVIDARMWRGVILIGTVMAATTLLTIDLYLPGGMLAGDRDIENARTAGFTVLVLAQLFNALNARSETASAFRRMFDNRWLWAAIGFALLLQVAVVHLPWLNVAFGTGPLRLDQWAVCLVLASAVLWVSELRKLTARLAAQSRYGGATAAQARASSSP